MWSYGSTYMGKLQYEWPTLALCGELSEVTTGVRPVVSGGGRPGG